MNFKIQKDCRALYNALGTQGLYVQGMERRKIKVGEAEKQRLWHHCQWQAAYLEKTGNCKPSDATQHAPHTHTIWFYPDLCANNTVVMYVHSDECMSKTMGQILYEYLRIPPRVIRKRNISLIRLILTCKTTRVQHPWPRATIVTVGWFADRTVTIAISGTPDHQNYCFF